MGSALFKPMEYSDCRAEKLSLSGLAALLALKRPPGAGDTAGLWEAACALLLKQMCVVPARRRRRRGPPLIDVSIWGECIIEYPGSFQPDSWTNWLSCVPRWWEPPRSIPGELAQCAGHFRGRGHSFLSPCRELTSNRKTQNSGCPVVSALCQPCDCKHVRPSS